MSLYIHTLLAALGEDEERLKYDETEAQGTLYVCVCVCVCVCVYDFVPSMCV